MPYPSDASEPFVVGCIDLPSTRVLVAAEREPGHPPRRLFGPPLVFFYVAPEGRWDEGSGYNADPWRRFRDDLPLTGGYGIDTGRIERVGRVGPMYVDGQASADVDSVTVHYLMPSGETGLRHAEHVRIGPRLARRLGAAGPFTYFVAEIPAAADTCRGIAVEAQARNGSTMDHEVLERFQIANPSARIPLPGSCPCRASDPFRGSIAERMWSPLSGLRLTPILTAGQVADLLRVGHSTVRAYAREGLLPSIELGMCVRFRREDVYWFTGRGL